MSEPIVFQELKKLPPFKDIEQIISVLRVCRNEDMFSGSNAEKGTAWKKAYEKFLATGGTVDASYVKKKLEILNNHDVHAKFFRLFILLTTWIGFWF